MPLDLAVVVLPIFLCSCCWLSRIVIVLFQFLPIDFPYSYVYFFYRYLILCRAGMNLSGCFICHFSYPVLLLMKIYKILLIFFIISVAEDSSNSMNISERLDRLLPQALVSFNSTMNATEDSCGRLNIMGTIVNDSAPYLFPFIIEYSLIGAAVIYVMWKHIGRNPK